MIWRTMMGAALAAAVAIGGRTASADVIYGVDDSAALWSVNTSSGAASKLTDGFGPKGRANALALDKASGALYFRQPEDGDLYKYVIGSGTANPSLVNVAGDVLKGANNAAFWNNAYWFIANGTNELYKVDMSTGASPTNQLVATLHWNNKALKQTTADIAISDDGTLYMASNSGFYHTSLVTSATSLTLTKGSASLPTDFQLAILTDGTLIGQAYSNTGSDPTRGKWYTIDPSSGARTLRAGLPSNPIFRDIAGTTAVPEPASVALMGIGVGAAVVFGRRRLKGHA